MILMVGIPGSGKTTLAKGAFPSHVRVSLDDLKHRMEERRSLLERYDAEVSPRDPGLSKNRRAEYVLVRDALREGRNVVIDDTNVERDLRRGHILLAREHGAVVNAVFFQNIHLAYMRNAARHKPVPKKALDDFYGKLEPPTNDEGISFIQIV